MLFREIRDILDMKLVLSVHTGTPIEKFAAENGMFIPASLVVSPDYVGSLYFFDDRAVEGRNVDIFLKASRARELKGKQTLFTSDRVYPQYKFFGRELLDLPSVIIDAHFVEGPSHHFHFRFHSSMIARVSELVTSSHAPEGMSVEYLGPNVPDRDIMSYMAGRMSLAYVSLVSTPPDRMLGSQENPLRVTEWKRETKYIRTDGKIRSIYYLDRPLETVPANVTEIYRDRRIYEAESENPVLSEIARLSPHITIPALNRSQSLSGNRFEMQCVGPAMFKQEFMERVKAARDRYPEWNIVLSGVEQLASR